MSKKKRQGKSRRKVARLLQPGHKAADFARTESRQDVSQTDLSYDKITSLPVPYENSDALTVARNLDAKIEKLLRDCC